MFIACYLLFSFKLSKVLNAYRLNSPTLHCSGEELFMFSTLLLSFLIFELLVLIVLLRLVWSISGSVKSISLKLVRNLSLLLKLLRLRVGRSLNSLLFFECNSSGL